MKKVFLSLVAVLLCGLTFAQEEIWTEDQFLAMEAGEDYELMADINLGDRGTLNASIIPTYSGTFNGNGFTITYQAGFQGVSGTTAYSLFGSVSGTIKNLNVNANVTLGGTVNMMDVALICGSLTPSGVIEKCNVSGNVNSTVVPTAGGGSDAGLIVGQSAGTVRYCTGSGNVAGVGYVGGLIGQMTGSASVLGCSFSGSVTANKPSSEDGEAFGNFAGGICGQCSRQLFSNTYPTISFCTVDATINRENTNDGQAEGLGNSAAAGLLGGPFGADVDGGRASWTNCYGEGTVDGNVITTDGQLANNTGVNGNTLYFEGEMTPGEIVEALNNANTDPNFYFAVVNGEVVLVIGAMPEEELVCEAPTGLMVTEDEGMFTAEWTMQSQDNDFTESNFVLTVSGGDLTTPRVREVQGATSIIGDQALPASTNPYVFTVKSKCDDELYSAEVTYSLYVNDCHTVSNLQASNVTSTSANITWEGEAVQVKLNGEVVELTNEQSLALSGLNPATTYTVEAIANCTENGVITPLATSITFTTHRAAYETAATGGFNDPNTWEDGEVPQGTIAEIKINQGHKVTVSHDLKITGTYKIVENNGALRISQQGQLINTTSTNVPGIVEIESVTKNMNKWSFVGAPFEDYKLEVVMPYPNSDVAMVEFDYGTGNWSTDWAHIGTTIGRGEGVFAWPFIDATMSFTTYGDIELGADYNYTGTATYNLNNAETFDVTGAGNWMALANPYPAKLSVSKFVEDNAGLQGTTIYGWNGSWFDIATQGDVKMTEGFFVNVSGLENKKVTFRKDQMTNYPATENTTGAKSSSNEFIELTLQNGNDKVRVYFAHNEDAEQGYDIFDANKMFATTGVAEPYFVTDGIALIKEEVAELPYYATMNVRSQQDTVMNFVLTNLPEGYAVSIIDGEEVIDLVEGGVYSTEILTGENADRFKVLVKKNVGLADVEELDVTIINSNRHISITAQEDVKVTVYNTLGQRVFETEKTDFVLSGVASGAYVVKVQGAKAAKSQKIIVE